jgi:hypothetical protein
MEKIRKFLKERKNGILLLFFALAIVGGFSAQSKSVASDEKTQNVSGSNQPEVENQREQSEVDLISVEGGQEETLANNSLQSEENLKDDDAQGKVEVTAEVDVDSFQKNRCGELKDFWENIAAKTTMSKNAGSIF